VYDQGVFRRVVLDRLFNVAGNCTSVCLSFMRFCYVRHDRTRDEGWDDHASFPSALEVGFVSFNARGLKGLTLEQMRKNDRLNSQVPGVQHSSICV